MIIITAVISHRHVWAYRTLQDRQTIFICIKPKHYLNITLYSSHKHSLTHTHTHTHTHTDAQTEFNREERGWQKEEEFENTFTPLLHHHLFPVQPLPLSPTTLLHHLFPVQPLPFFTPTIPFLCNPYLFHPPPSRHLFPAQLLPFSPNPLQPHLLLVKIPPSFTPLHHHLFPVQPWPLSPPISFLCNPSLFHPPPSTTISFLCT